MKMPNVNVEAELIAALLENRNLMHRLQLMTDSYDKLCVENQQLRSESELHCSVVQGKNDSLERIIRERDALKVSESNFRNMLRGLRNQHKLLNQYRDLLATIHRNSWIDENGQVSEASGESNESNLVAQGIPAGGEIRHDREAKTACDSQNSGTIGQSAVGQGSALSFYKCRECGADRR